jgi:hypothetical protein
MFSCVFSTDVTIPSFLQMLLFRVCCAAFNHSVCIIRCWSACYNTLCAFTTRCRFIKWFLSRRSMYVELSEIVTGLHVVLCCILCVPMRGFMNTNRYDHGPRMVFMNPYHASISMTFCLAFSYVDLSCVYIIRRAQC